MRRMPLARVFYWFVPWLTPLLAHAGGGGGGGGQGGGSPGLSVEVSGSVWLGAVASVLLIAHFSQNEGPAQK